jgi:NAD-dependent DNA ligase
MDIKNESNRLELWKEASIAYSNGNPIMTDYQFDLLTEELLLIYPPDSEEYNLISKSVGDAFIEVEYLEHSMISLFKIKHQPNYIQFEIRKFFKEYPGVKIYYSPKFDGVSIKYNPSNSEIYTRNGIVTDKLKDKLSIYKDYKHLVCGELVIKKSIFNEKYSDEYTNPRTLVSSVISPKSTKNPEFIDDFDFVPCTNGVNKFGDVWKELTDVNELESIWHSFQNNVPYSIDGIVLAVDEVDNTRKVKNNYPLNMVAIKFPQSTIQTNIVDIQWNLGKTGKYIPVAIVQPVSIENSEFTNVQLYNYDFVRINKLGIGATITLSKNGYESVITKSSNIPLPQSSMLVGKNLISTNDEINKQQKFISSLQYVADTYNIKGFGEKKCIEVGKLFDFDIFELFNPQNMLKLPITGKVGSDLYQKLSTITTMKLQFIIMLCNFNNVGDKLAEKLATALMEQAQNKRITVKLSESNKHDFITPRTPNWMKINRAIQKILSFKIKIV